MKRWMNGGVFSSICLVLGVVLSGCGGGAGDDAGMGIEDEIVNSMPNPDTSASAVIAEASQAVSQKLASGNSPDALAEAIAELNANPAIAKAELSSDNATIIIHLPDGTLAHIFTDRNDAQTDDAGSLNVSKAAKRNISSDRFFKAVSKTFAGPKRAVLYLPFQDQFKLDIPALSRTLSDAGYTVTSYINTDATVTAFTDILNGDYGIIVIDTHGGIGPAPDNQVLFLTREPYDSNKLTTEYKDLPLDKGSALGWPGVFFHFNPRILGNCRFSNTLVWAGACHSLQNNTMAEAFVDNGAGVYFGYTDAIATKIGGPALNVFFRNLVRPDTSAQMAYQSVKSDPYLSVTSIFDHIFNKAMDIALLTYYPQGAATGFCLISSDSPPTLTNLAVTGNLIEGQAGRITVSCTATPVAQSKIQEVKADLSQIGGPAVQPLTSIDGTVAESTVSSVEANGATNWSWSGTVTPTSSGEKTITFSATDSRSLTATATATITVAPATTDNGTLDIRSLKEADETNYSTTDVHLGSDYNTDFSHPQADVGKAVISPVSGKVVFFGPYGSSQSYGELLVAIEVSVPLGTLLPREDGTQKALDKNCITVFLGHMSRDKYNSSGVLNTSAPRITLELGSHVTAGETRIGYIAPDGRRGVGSAPHLHVGILPYSENGLGKAPFTTQSGVSTHFPGYWSKSDVDGLQKVQAIMIDPAKVDWSRLSDMPPLVPVATPTFDPNGGTFTGSRSVTIRCATSGATIHYTTDNSTPTESSAVIASSGAVTVDHTLTLKAKAWKAGVAPSLVGEASYIVGTTTLTAPPTVGSPSSSSLSARSALLGGTVSALGGANVTERGIYWSTSNGFTPPGQGTKASETGDWSSAGTFAVSVTGLPAGSMVYYKAFATNTAGTGWTSQSSLNMDKDYQTITFDVPAARTYGDSAFALSATASSGLPVTFAGDNSSVARVSGSTVTIVGAGTTTITASQAGNTAYNPATSVQQTLTVNKKELTVTADNQTRDYNQANPSFTVSYAGFVSGESAADLDVPPAATCAATLTSLPGTYDIVPAGGTDGNYRFTYENGRLTIVAVAPTVDSR